MRTRLPVRLKLAVVTAALTFGDPLPLRGRDRRRGRAAHPRGLRRRPARHRGRPADRLNVRRGATAARQFDIAALAGAAAGGAQVRVVRTDGTVGYPERAARRSPSPARGLTDLPGYRGRLARARAAARLEPASAFGPLGGRWPSPSATSSTPSRKATRRAHGEPRARCSSPSASSAARCSPSSAASTSPSARCARSPGSPARRARWPARATRTSRCPSRRPTTRWPTSPTRFEDMLARAGRRARRDRGDARAPARLRGRRLARAAHAADQHPRQPRAARARARGRAARDGRLRAALVAGGCAGWSADLLLLARADAGREAPRAAGRPRRRGARGRRRGRPRSPPATRCRSTCPTRSCRSTGVADDLHRLVANLIENALVHTAAGHAGDRVR